MSTITWAELAEFFENTREHTSDHVTTAKGVLEMLEAECHLRASQVTLPDEPKAETKSNMPTREQVANWLSDLASGKWRPLAWGGFEKVLAEAGVHYLREPRPAPRMPTNRALALVLLRKIFVHEMDSRFFWECMSHMRVAFGLPSSSKTCATHQIEELEKLASKSEPATDQTTINAAAWDGWKKRSDIDSFADQEDGQERISEIEAAMKRQYGPRQTEETHHADS